MCAEILIVFIIVKTIINHLLEVLPGVNVYYNPLHKILYSAFDRKSFHLLAFMIYKQLNKI